MHLRSLVVSALATTGLVAVALTAAPPAFAGECPAGQMRADATKSVNYGPMGVTDKVLSQIDLAGEKVSLNGHLMRVRKLEVQPGGIVPWHSHEDRPALIYVVTGEIVEHASNCAQPIVHKAGEVARETHATAHWWKNEGKATVVLLSFDIQHDPNDKNM
jgi:quercetin dioxygenase-like cupin family protein